MKHATATSNFTQIISRIIAMTFFILVCAASFAATSSDIRPTPATIASKEPKLFPFGLKSISAEMKGAEKVVISWITAPDKNTSHFIMQRSTDGKTFDDAALLFIAEGNEQASMEYRYADHILPAENASVIYYRLKMVDNKGIACFSPAIPVHTDKPEQFFAVN